MALIPDQKAEALDAYIVSQNLSETLKLVKNLRENGWKTEFDMQGKNFSKGFEKALKSVAKFAIILGEDEIAQNKITVKNLATKEQNSYTLAEVLKLK